MNGLPLRTIIKGRHAMSGLSEVVTRTDSCSRPSTLRCSTVAAAAVLLIAAHLAAPSWLRAGHPPGSEVIVTVEDFNSDGDGVRYTIEGRFLAGAADLWTTVPDSTVVPGLPMLAGIEAGELLFDGTAAAERRVVFHTERRTDGSLLNGDGLGLLDAAVSWASPGSGRNIVFVTSDGNFDGQFNTFWRDRLDGQGHTVSAVDDDTAVDTSGVDLFIIASNVNDSAVAQYKDVAVPVINYHSLANDDLSLTSDRGDDITGNTFQIVDDSHPLAAGIADGAVTLTSGGADTRFNVATDRGQMLMAPGANVVMTELDTTVSVETGDIAFTNFEGSGYLAGADLDAGEAGVAVQLNPIDTSADASPHLLIALAARPSGFDEGEDFIRILADADNDGTFELDVAQVLPADGFLVAPGGIQLSDEFQDLLFDIPSSSQLVLRVEANSTAGGERIGIDNIRIVIPEPATAVLMMLGLLGAVGLSRRRRA